MSVSFYIVCLKCDQRQEIAQYCPLSLSRSRVFAMVSKEGVANFIAEHLKEPCHAAERDILTIHIEENT